MDTTPKQLIAAVKKLIEELRSANGHLGRLHDAIRQYTATLNKIQTAKEQVASKQKESEAPKEPRNAQINIKGPVEIDLIEDLKKEYKTAKTQTTTHNDKQLLWTKVSAGLIFIYAGLTFWQACSTRNIAQLSQQTYDASQRPYVGSHGIQPIYLWFDADRTAKLSDVPTNKTIQLEFRAGIKNFGPVPGANFKPSWKVLVGGVPMEQTTIPNRPYTIFPGEEAILTGTSGTDNYPILMSGAKTLVIEVTSEYDGAKHYTECQKYQYAPKFNGFFALGSCNP